MIPNTPDYIKASTYKITAHSLSALLQRNKGLRKFKKNRNAKILDTEDIGQAPSEWVWPIVLERKNSTIVDDPKFSTSSSVRDYIKIVKSMSEVPITDVISVKISTGRTTMAIVIMRSKSSKQGWTHSMGSLCAHPPLKRSGR